MVRHQDIRIEIKRITPSDRSQRFKKCLIVALAHKYLLPVITTRHHVVQHSFSMHSGMARHWTAITELVELGKSDTTFNVVRKLNQNKPAFRDGNVLIANLLAAGEFPLAITYAHLVERLRMRGAPVDWVAVKPLVAVPISLALPARSAHPNAANLFVDLVLSKEGSELLKSMGRVPTRSDVQPSARQLDPKSLELVPLHVSSDEMDPEEFRKSFGLK